MSDRDKRNKTGQVPGFEDAQVPFAPVGSATFDDELEIDRIFRRIWRKKWTILLSTIACFIFAVLAIAAIRGGDRHKTYRYIVQFTFNGREIGEYPNGSPFAMRDLLAPSILADVHQTNRLDEFGIDGATFPDRVSISPFAADREAILSRYQTEYDKWITSATELRELPDRAAEELRRASQYSALIEFSDFDGTVPADRAGKIVRNIVETWARKAVEERGVIRVNIDRISPALFDEASFAWLAPLNQLRSFKQRATALSGFIDAIEEQPNGSVVTDSETGFNIPSLKARLNNANIGLMELPVMWSRHNLAKADIARLPLKLYSDEIFDPQMVLKQDYLVALDLATERISLLRQDVNAILEEPNGGTVTDPQSGFTAYDIVQLLDDLEKLQIDTLRSPIVELGISRDLDVVALHYEAQLNRAKRKRIQLAAAYKVIDDAGDRYSGHAKTQEPSRGEDSPDRLFSGNGSTVIPQLGDGFIDRLIRLSEQGGDTAFRQELTRESIAIQREITEVDAEIARIDQFLEKLRQHENDLPTDSSPRARLAKEYSQRVESELPKAITLLQEYAGITRRLALRMRYAQEIHAILFAGEDNPAVKPDYYLRDVDTGNAGTESVLADFREITEIANRIYDLVGKENFGESNGLYRALGEVEVLREPLLTRSNLLLAVGLALAGFMLALFYVLFKPATRRMET